MFLVYLRKFDKNEICIYKRRMKLVFSIHGKYFIIVITIKKSGMIYINERKTEWMNSSVTGRKYG